MRALHRALSRPPCLTSFAVIVGLAFVHGIIWAPQSMMEGCRVANVPLALVVALGFYVRVNDLWPQYGRGGRIMRAGMLLLLLVCAGGSAEAYLTHAELGYRAVVLNIALLTIGVGLLVADDRLE